MIFVQADQSSFAIMKVSSACAGSRLCTPPGRQEGVLALSRNCMDAAAMSLELHGCGNHAV
jgi:hypothetical protein